MRKYICLILALVLCLSLCACGEKETEKKATEPTATQETAAETTAATTPEATQATTSETTTGSGASDSAFSFSIPTFELEPVKPVTVNPNVIDFDFTLDLKIPEIEPVEFNSNTFLNDAAMNFSAEDLETLKGMDAAQLVKYAEIQQSLLADLNLAFESVGLTVVMDEKTGEVALDAAVLFDVDSAELSQEGKTLLKEFAQTYSYVVFNEKYNGSVAKILVEGHTDSDGAYDYNMTLSQKRAEAVLSYVLSSECGVADEYLQPLKDSAEAKGYSYDRPVLDASGKEDKAASRRVTFRFLINVD